MSFRPLHYDDSPRDISNHVISPRDFRPQQLQHADAIDTIQPYSASGRSVATTFSGAVVDRIPYMPTTSGFVGPSPTSGLPYPFYNFDAMHAVADLTDNIGAGCPLPEVDFRAMTSSAGYSTTNSLGAAGLQRYADCRPSPITTATAGFLSPDRTPYVNGGTPHMVSANSVTGQQMSPPSVVTPTSPTAVVYPWMTIVGLYSYFYHPLSVHSFSVSNSSVELADCHHHLH